MVAIEDYVSVASSSPLASFSSLAPWILVARAESIVRELMSSIQADEYSITGDIAIHKSASVESTATLKGPLILGPHSFVARRKVWPARN
jgi:hypothetical protein